MELCLNGFTIKGLNLSHENAKGRLKKIPHGIIVSTPVPWIWGILGPGLDNIQIYLYRLLSEALVLTGADICSAVKPWDVQYPTTMDIFSEYHDQVMTWNSSI